jgi:hypothetical protein
MSAPLEQNQEKDNSKELNFRALEAKYEKQLAQEREEKEALKRQMEERMNPVEDEDDDEPYVDKKKLSKTLNKFGEHTQKQTRTVVASEVQKALYEERKRNWLNSNSDFYDTMKHADKLMEVDPQLAETILEMPEGFERQKLVYRNIKALKLDMPVQKEPSIQEKIDSNRRSPYYQPSGIANAPYANSGNFSPQGQKEAYEKLQQLKQNLRL